MRKSRVEFSVLNRKAAIEASSVALGVRMASRLSTGRTTAFSHSTKGVPFVESEAIEFSSGRPIDRVHQGRLDILVKSADAAASAARDRVFSAQAEILLWPEGDGSFDFKKLASIGRRGRRTAQGFDPNAEDADGDMLVQDGTPWERPKVPGASKRGKRKPGKTRVAVASGLERVADRIDEAAEKRRSRRQERGSLRQRIAGRLERAADRIDKKPGEKPKRTRRSPGDYVFGTERVRRGGDKPAPEDVPEVPEAPEEPAKPEKPATPVEDVTTTATAKKKLPGRVIGKPDEDRAFVLTAARDASKAKGEDSPGQRIHVIEAEDGKFVAVDEDRLNAMDWPPTVATFKDGQLLEIDGVQKKKNGKTVTNDQVEAAPGWSMKETYEQSALDRLDTLENSYFYNNGGKQFAEGENAYVVKTSDGKYHIVDEEKMQALGVEPIKARKVGKGEFVYGTEPKQDFVPRKPVEDKPVGEIPGEPPMEKPSLPDVAEDAKSPKSKKPKLKGKQDGKYKTEKNASKRADELSAGDGKVRHVVEAPGGGYAVVDQDRLDAMGVEPVSTHNGKKIETPEPGASEAPEAEKPKEVAPAEKITSKKTPKQSIQYLNRELDKAQKLYDAGDKEGATASAEQSLMTIQKAREDGFLKANEYTAESFSALLDELRWHAEGHPGLEEDAKPEAPKTPPAGELPGYAAAKKFKDDFDARAFALSRVMDTEETLHVVRDGEDYLVVNDERLKALGDTVEQVHRITMEDATEFVSGGKKKPEKTKPTMADVVRKMPADEGGDDEPSPVPSFLQPDQEPAKATEKPTKSEVFEKLRDPETPFGKWTAFNDAFSSDSSYDIDELDDALANLKEARDEVYALSDDEKDALGDSFDQLIADLDASEDKIGQRRDIEELMREEEELAASMAQSDQPKKPVPPPPPPAAEKTPKGKVGTGVAKSVMAERKSILGDVAEMDEMDEEELRDAINEAHAETAAALNAYADKFDELVGELTADQWPEVFNSEVNKASDPSDQDAAKIIAQVLDENPGMSKDEAKAAIAALSSDVAGMESAFGPLPPEVAKSDLLNSLEWNLEAEWLNDTIGGSYDEDELEEFKTTFQKALDELESLSPAAKIILGEDYESMREGHLRNIAIINNSIDTGASIEESVKEFFAEQDEAVTDKLGNFAKSSSDLLDADGNLKESATIGKASFLIDNILGESDIADSPEAQQLVNRLQKAIKVAMGEGPVNADSPLPYKTSKSIDVDSIGTIKGTEEEWDIDGLKEQFDGFLESASEDLISYLASEKIGGVKEDMDAESAEKALAESVAKLAKAVDSADAFSAEQNGAIIALQRNRAHLHNLRVMAGLGRYSKDESPDITPFDRFNHLSPTGQKTFFKTMEKDFREQLKNPSPGEEALTDEEVEEQLKEVMGAYQDLTSKKKKKPSAKKTPAEEMKESIVADPQAEKPKPATPAGPSLRIGKENFEVFTPEQVRETTEKGNVIPGLSSFDAETEAKFPEGLILGYVGSGFGQQSPAEALSKPGALPHFRKGTVEGTPMISSFVAPNGETVTAILDDGHPFWQGEDGLDTIFPDIYEDPKEGSLSHWVNYGKPKEDKSPLAGSVLAGLTEADFDVADMVDDYGKYGDKPSMMAKRAALRAMGESPWSLMTDGSEEDLTKELDDVLSSRFGANGGAIVKTPEDTYHVMSSADLAEAQENGASLEVVHKSTTKSMNWALSSNKAKGKKLSDVDWASLTQEEADEALKTFLGRSNDEAVSTVLFPKSANVAQFSQVGAFGYFFDVPTAAEHWEGLFEGAAENLLLHEQGEPVFLSRWNDDMDGRWGVFAFNVSKVEGSNSSGSTTIVGALGGEELDFALAHPEVFGKPIVSYDRESVLNSFQSTPQSDAMPSQGILGLLDDNGKFVGADAALAQINNGDSVLDLAAKWRNKLIKPGQSYDDALANIENVNEETEKRMRTMLATLETAQGLAADALGLEGADRANVTIEQMKGYIGVVDPTVSDADAWWSKLRSTAVRLDVGRRLAADTRMAEADRIETELELKDKIASNPKLAKDFASEQKQIRKDIEDATGALDAAMAELKAATTSEATTSAYKKMGEADSRIRSLKALDSAYETALTDYKNTTSLVGLASGEYEVPKKSVAATGLADIQKATEISAAVAPLYPSGTSLGIYKEPSGSYSIIKLDDAIDAGMPAPDAVFSSSGVGGIPVVDTPKAMDLKTAPGMPKLPDDYEGTKNLGVNSFDGTAVGQYVPTPMLPDGSEPPIDENHPLVREWAAKVADGSANLADVPNELLKEVVWGNTEGGGAWASGRFRLLSKASGYNDMGKPPKDQTQRFMDTATGQTFVIKSATRNDQEGIRELFGNQVMQLLGFPSSGGRTAGPVEKSPNKFPFGHPEHDPEAEQVAVLIESSEMLYDGKSLGHVRSLPKSERADIVARLTPESVGTGLVMDSLFRYYDRQEDNWIAVELPDGSVAYHPIDHGNAFGPFKGHKFFDKNGNKLSKSQSTPEDEDRLGFMFSGLDGDGVWELAKESMTTPERKAAFAEGVLHAVRRAESNDYAGAGERLISEQNLTGQLAERVRTSAKELDGKKARLDSYVDPMLKELGMTDDEIAAARSKVDTDLGGGAAKASQAPKKAVAASPAPKMASPTPIKGEEAFGNTPIAEGAKTVTASLDDAVASPGSVHYTSVGAGRQTKDGVRFAAFKTQVEGMQVVSAGTTLDGATAKKLGESLEAGKDLQGNPVTVIMKRNEHAAVQLLNGKWVSGETIENSNVRSFGEYGTNDRFIVARLSDGTLVSVNYSVDPDKSSSTSYASRGMTQLFYTDGKPSPDRVASSLSAIGVSDLGYAGEEDWKPRAAELLVRTWDNELQNGQEPIATRLARVAQKYGVTLNDVEPYHDSMGRLRYRLTEEAWEEVLKKNPALGNTTHIVKSMNDSPGGANVVRVVTTGGMLSKQEQVMSGVGLDASAPEGGGSTGAGSAGTDMNVGGGLGLFMTPFSGKTGKANGTHKNSGSYWGKSYPTHVVYDGQKMMRDLGWWAHGPEDGPYGSLNAATLKAEYALNNSAYGGDSITAMEKEMVFEFLPNGSASLEGAMGIIVSSGTRTAVINSLKDRGITKVNGIPLEKFIVSSGSKKGVAEMIGPTWELDRFGPVSGLKSSASGTV